MQWKSTDTTVTSTDTVSERRPVQNFLASRRVSRRFPAGVKADWRFRGYHIWNRSDSVERTGMFRFILFPSVPRYLFPNICSRTNPRRFLYVSLRGVLRTALTFGIAVVLSSQPDRFGKRRFGMDVRLERARGRPCAARATTQSSVQRIFRDAVRGDREAYRKRAPPHMQLLRAGGEGAL